MYMSKSFKQSFSKTQKNIDREEIKCNRKDSPLQSSIEGDYEIYVITV